VLKHPLTVLLPLSLAFSYGLTSAWGAIYTWTDASGRVNVSNLAPPEGTRVTSVVPESPPIAPGTSTADDAARRLEVQTLADRVRQLEFEAQLAQRPPPPVATYQMPPVASYQMPPVQYSEFPPVYADAPDPGCNPAWAGCGNWWTPFGYPTIVVVQSPFRHARPIKDGHNMPIQRPMRPFGVAYRR
jgi:Domain of unknown function (DUF4124)